jgi:hypothetical protein
MITSFIPGRIRLREARLKDPDFAAAMAAALKTQTGVTKASANPVTGGLLLEYDQDKVDTESVLTALATVDPDGFDEFLKHLADLETRGGSPGFLPAVGANYEIAEYATLFLSFVICASSAFLRSKGLHVYSGLSLAGLTVQHVLKYRKRLQAIFSKAP